MGRQAGGRRAAAVAGGVRGAVAMLRRLDPALLGALAWWAFDIAVLWACFHAFGEPPPLAVVVMAYFTGMLGNLLPLPGGVGGVEGGMIAAFIGVRGARRARGGRGAELPRVRVLAADDPGSARLPAAAALRQGLAARSSRRSPMSSRPATAMLAPTTAVATISSDGAASSKNSRDEGSARASA